MEVVAEVFSYFLTNNRDAFFEQELRDEMTVVSDYCSPALRLRIRNYRFFLIVNDNDELKRERLVHVTLEHLIKSYFFFRQ